MSNALILGKSSGGELSIRQATGSITIAANTTVTIQLDFTPLAAITVRTDASNRSLNAMMVYNTSDKSDACFNVFDTSYQGYFQEFKPVGNTLSITARAYPATATYTWYAIGL